MNNTTRRRIWKWKETFLLEPAAGYSIGTVDKETIGEWNEGAVTEKIRQRVFNAVTGKILNTEVWLHIGI